MRGRKWWAAIAVVALMATTGAGGEDGEPEIEGESLDYDETIELAVEDIEAFWTEAMPRAFDQRYQPVEGVYAYDSTTDPFPECYGGETYETQVDNAFYCPLLDFVAYDDEILFPRLFEDGNFGIILILAHEWGHFIEDQLGVLGVDPPLDTIITETAADCFAGAYTRYVDRGRSDLLALEEGDLDVGLQGLISIADPVGFDPGSPAAHGSAFDRVAAFQEGFRSGAGRCGEYFADLPEFEEITFSESEDLATGGNLPPEEIISLTTEDLDSFWSETLSEYEPVSAVIPYTVDGRLPTCGGEEADPDAFEFTIFYCEEGDFIAWDSELLAFEWEDKGDFAVATVIAGQWSAAIQARLGLRDDGNAFDRARQLDCFTGAWIGDVSDNLRGDDASLLLSPGDLDEAMQSMLDLERLAETKFEDEETAFVRVESVRQGFNEGADSCESIVESDEKPKKKRKARNGTGDGVGGGLLD